MTSDNSEECPPDPCSADQDTTDAVCLRPTLHPRTSPSLAFGCQLGRCRAESESEESKESEGDAEKVWTGSKQSLGIGR